MKRIICVIFMIFCGTSLSAYTVSGKITDKKTGESISGVSIAIEEIRDVRVTGADGTYKFDRIPAGFFTVHTAHPLYGNQNISIRVKRTFILDIELSEKTYSVKPLVNSTPGNVMRPGNQSISSDDIKYMPMSGVGDSLHLLQALPGVGISFSMASVPVIRGLNPIYDKIYIDDIPVDYPYHYFPPVVPLLSAINETVIDTATINKGPYPLIYDDSIGSIIQVKTKEVQRPGVHGGVIVNPLVPLFPTIYCEAAPIADFSIIFAGRRTYIDWGYEAAEVESDTDFHFQDHYLKLKYNLFSKHRIYFTSMGADDYISVDKIRARSEYRIDSLKWQYLINKNYFLETSFMRNRINHYFKDKKTDGTDAPAEVTLSPLIYRIMQTLTADLSVIEMKTGYDYTIHKDGVSGNINLSELVDYEIENQTGGLTSVSYPIEGKSFSVFNETGIDLDPVHLNFGARYKYYGPLESSSLSYRGMASYTVKKENLKIYGGGGSYRAQPDMYYYLGDYLGTLEEARSYNGVLGMEKRLTPEITGQVEAYYAKYDYLFSGIFEAVSSTELRRLSQINPYSRDESGKGYGVEFFVKGKIGSFYGWTSCAISKTRMSDSDEEYASDYDQTRIFKIAVLTHRGRWTPSAIWHYYTSMPYTPVTGSTEGSDGEYSPEYGSYNSKRYPAHNRLDLKLTYTVDNLRVYAEMWNVYYINGYDRNDSEIKKNSSYLFPVYDRDKPYSSSNPDMQEDLPPVFFWVGLEICF